MCGDLFNSWAFFVCVEYFYFSDFMNPLKTLWPTKNTGEGGEGDLSDTLEKAFFPFLD